MAVLADVALRVVAHPGGCAQNLECAAGVSGFPLVGRVWVLGAGQNFGVFAADGL